MTEQEKKAIYKFLKEEQKKYFELAQKALEKHDYEEDRENWVKYQAISDLTIALIRKDWAAYENT